MLEEPAPSNKGGKLQGHPIQAIEQVRGAKLVWGASTVGGKRKKGALLRFDILRYNGVTKSSSNPKYDL